LQLYTSQLLFTVHALLHLETIFTIFLYLETILRYFLCTGSNSNTLAISSEQNISHTALQRSRLDLGCYVLIACLISY
jgi:hypothetical protein